MFVDTETIGAKDDANGKNNIIHHTLRLGVAIAVNRKRNQWCNREVKEFKTVGEFWQFAFSRVRPRQPLTIYAHNWHYDAQALNVWQLLDQRILNLGLPERISKDKETGLPVKVKAWAGLAAIEDKPFILYVTSKFGTIKLIDTMNYWPMALAGLGKSFGIPKTDMPDDREDDRTWFDYCGNDCAIIEKAICTTIDQWFDEDRGNWQPTAARLAMSNFRHKFMNIPIIIDKDKSTKEVKAIERASYFGGETRCWYKGHCKGPLYHVDVTGLFPSVMATGTFPCELEGHYHDGKEFPADQAYRAIANVVVNSTWRDIPKRTLTGHNYPAGRNDTTLAGPELANAIANGQVESVSSYCLYRLEPIFKDYIGHWFGIRAKAKSLCDDASNLLAKLMMNSLYGKFAARKPGWTIQPKIVPPCRWGPFIMPHPKTGELASWRAVAGVAQLQSVGEESEESFIAISSFVTAAARLYMRNVREYLPRRSCLLQTVDSLLLTQDGFDALRETIYWGGESLGTFRLLDTYQWAYVFDAVHWFSDKCSKMAGLPKHAINIGGNTFEYFRPDNSKMIAHSGPRDGITWRRQEVTIGNGGSEVLYGEDGWALDMQPEQLERAMLAEESMDQFKWHEQRKYGGLVQQTLFS